MRSRPVPQPITQSQSPFFDLPPEIRDGIYSQVFGDTSIILECGEVNTIAVTKSRSLPKPEHKGLPIWLATCKQTCSEALAVFGQTRQFFARNYVSRERMYAHFPRPRIMLRPLVFNAQVIRNIVTSGEMMLLCRGVGIATREFLRKLKTLDVHDICLETSWIRSKQDPQWAIGETNEYGKWSEFWNGRFWKGRITVMAIWIADEALDKLSEVAERFAKRLVGDDAVVAKWEDLGTSVVNDWTYKKRCVVVERKA